MRKLTLRERVLLILLAIVVVISAYVMLFSMPLSQRAQALTDEIAQADELALQLEVRLAEQQRMERELKQLETAEDAPVPMPEYDNQHSVMIILNGILKDCRDYSLSFQSDQVDEQVYCRRAVIPFTCDSYHEARAILQRLHDCPLRCVLEDVELQQQEDGSVSTVATVSFLEYRTEQPAEDASVDAP